MFYILIYSFFPVILGFNAVLDIEELTSVYYNIDIVKNPVLKRSEWNEDILTVVNKFGQEYVCNIPEIERSSNENNKEENLEQLVDIASLLKPMESIPCLLKKKDWWTYEFCYGSVIKQYHMEDNKVLGPILFLGKYESEYNWNNTTESKNKLEKYHSQYYVNGTRCDITGEPRRTEVRFHCEEGAGDYIKQVDEPQSCKYVVVIATTRLCHHPYLKPQSNKIPYMISCSPTLAEDQFEKYQRIEEIREQKKLSLGTKSSHELSGGKSLFTDGEEEEAKFSIRLLTIPLSGKKNSKKQDNDALKSIVTDEATSQDIVELFEDDDELSSQVNVEDGLNEQELKLLVDRIKSDVKKTLAKNIEILNNAKQLTADSPFKNKQDTDESKMEGTAESQEGVDEETYENEEIGSLSKNLKDNPSFAQTEGKNIRQKVQSLLHRWQETQNLPDFDSGDVEDQNEVMKKMLSDFEDTFAENPEFVKDVIDIADKYSKDLVLDHNSEYVLKNQNKMKELMSELLQTLDEDGSLKTGHSKNNMRKIYSEMQNLFLDKPEFFKEILKLGDKYSDEFIKDEDPESLADALKDQEKLKNVVKTIDDAVKATKDRAQKVRDRIRRLEGLFDKELIDKISSPGYEPRDYGSAEGKDITEAEDSGAENKLDSIVERTLDHSHKMNLEQKLKESLHKSGLDNIGSKIEVKILSPSLDEDDKDTPVTLSPEETEAIHSMIFNVLEATAEELKERERHQSLMDNYSFSMDESVLEESPVQVVANEEEGDGAEVTDVIEENSDPSVEKVEGEESEDKNTDYFAGR